MEEHQVDLMVQDDKEPGFTVYFRYRFVNDPKAGHMHDLHYGHAKVAASSIEEARDIVMEQENASMRGHTGDRGIVEFVYATNGVDPDKGMSVWICAPAEGSAGADGTETSAAAEHMEENSSGEERIDALRQCDS
jgi:hypothetical protein